MVNVLKHRSGHVISLDQKTNTNTKNKSFNASPEPIAYKRDLEFWSLPSKNLHELVTKSNQTTVDFTTKILSSNCTGLLITPLSRFVSVPVSIIFLISNPFIFRFTLLRILATSESYLVLPSPWSFPRSNQWKGMSLYPIFLYHLFFGVFWELISLIRL